MKKTVPIFVSLSLVFSLAACGKSAEDKSVGVEQQTEKQSDSQKKSWVLKDEPIAKTKPRPYDPKRF